MPPQTKISREIILEKSLEIVNNNGYEALNARCLAKELNCSVQPIYYQFSNMDELKDELVKMAYKNYEDYIYNANKGQFKYMNTGMAYIKFAKEKPNLFKLLFMTLNSKNIEDPTLDYVHEIAMEKTNLAYEKVKGYHFNMWVYVHGIASLIIAGILEYDEMKIEEMLKGEYDALIRRYHNV